MNNCMAGNDYINGRMRNEPREKGKSVAVNRNRRLFIHPDSCSNPLVSRSGGSCSFKNARSTIDATRHDKGKALCNSDAQNSMFRKGGNFAGLAEKNGDGDCGVSRVNASRKGVLPLNGFSAISSSDRSSKSCKLNNTLETGPSSDCGKGVGVLPAAHHKAESNASASMQPCTSSKVPRQKMLVRNGCISPHNIAKSKHVAEKHETGSVVKARSGSGTLASGGRSSMVDIKDLIADAKDSHRCKGKRVSCHPSFEEPAAGSGHLSHRRSILKAPVDSSSGFSVDASRCSAESERWRTTHNHRKQREIEHQKNGTMQRDHRNGRNVINLDEPEVVSSPCMRDPPQTTPPQKLGINGQREVTAPRNFGKRSMSSVDASAGEPSTSTPKRNKSLRGVGTSNSVSEPNTHNGNDEDSSVRALQVEADEMLARELQEQLYNEPTPAVEIREMDSRRAFAMPMQQDNSSRHAGGRHANRRRGPSTMNVHEYTRRPTIRRRLQRQVRTSTRMDPVRRLLRSRTTSSSSNRRSSIFPPNMDVDMRMQILETLEAVGDMRMPNDLLQVGREFNEDDYEMLLALDEDNHRHGGATRAQINNLPESTVQAENLQECSICLETPTVGETIRHLPCLHRFHKACIDEWLRRKTSCPVCKSSVT
ncbi:hypothetical protein L6452_29848 [Arctium lappa]|uniref:Uncharacterized protein n=1 Tax=Arctium lappa TaxID=4217 RepID=A0ACB8ZHW3_ARCLA|nr:hypothetical protein L6452_29848 [Arctium lappa]